MEKIFVIQDVKTKEYYWRYRIEDGFNANISEATTYSFEGECIEVLKDENLEDLFDGRVIEIKEYWSFLN